MQGDRSQSNLKTRSNGPNKKLLKQDNRRPAEATEGQNTEGSSAQKEEVPPRHTGVEANPQVSEEHSVAHPQTIVPTSGPRGDVGS